MNAGDILDGKYRILEHIDSGGMAHVFKAVNLSNRRIVAIKMLKDEFRDDAEFLRRFEREAHASLQLSHDNIVHAYALGKEDGLPYIVQEFVEGQTLKQLIVSGGALPIRTAIGICCQILDALSAAHANGIIHRDVKPQNVLISPKGKAKLTDFGIAREISASTVTFTGNQVIGSVHYISPEQAQGHNVTAASDIYSVGVTLYEMVTGIVPFDGDSTVTVALMHIRNQPIPPIDLNERISPALNDVILRAMTKSVSDRYGNAHAMRIDLIRTLSNPNGTFVHDHEPETDSKPAPRIRRKKKKKRTVYLWITLAVTVPILLLVLLYLWFSSEHAKEDNAAPYVDATASTASQSEPPTSLEAVPTEADMTMPSLYGMTFDDALYRLHALGFTEIQVAFATSAGDAAADNTVVTQSVKRGADVSNMHAIRLTVFRDDLGVFYADVTFTASIAENGSVVQIGYETANYNNIRYTVILFEEERAAAINATVAARLYSYDAATRTVKLLINGEAFGEMDARFAE